MTVIIAIKHDRSRERHALGAYRTFVSGCSNLNIPFVCLRSKLIMNRAGSSLDSNFPAVHLFVFTS